MIRRLATISMHTSPLDQPGTGDAGGMNVYLVETAKRLARRGVAVDIFTRATHPRADPRVELAPGVMVRHVPAGPVEPGRKDELPSHLCAFGWGMLREHPASSGHMSTLDSQRVVNGNPDLFDRPYDVVHSHYWLSGQAGRMMRRRWGTPLVHTAHTLGRVKNAYLAAGDRPEPAARLAGEELLAHEADALVANTEQEAEQLRHFYGARPSKIEVAMPGVDLARFAPADRQLARARWAIPEQNFVALFVGRIQPLKGPDVLVRAAAELATDPALRSRLTVLVCGGRSGSGYGLAELRALAAQLGVGDAVRFIDPLPPSELATLYQAADVTVVPSQNESFGLVAVESQACATPVVAAAVGGLTTAVVDGVSGVLVDGHAPSDYAAVLRRLAAEPAWRKELARGARQRAASFSWESTVDNLLAVYKRVTDGQRPALEQAACW